MAFWNFTLTVYVLKRADHGVAMGVARSNRSFYAESFGKNNFCTRLCHWRIPDAGGFAYRRDSSPAAYTEANKKYTKKNIVIRAIRL